MKVTLPDAGVIWEQYQTFGSVHRVAELHGCSSERVRKALVAGGFRLDHVKWSDEEDLVLIQCGDGDHPTGFQDAHKLLLRTPSATLERARKLGCLEPPKSRTKTSAAKVAQKRASLEFALSGAAEPKPETETEQPAAPAGNGKWQSGWYDINGKRLYVRSKWEYHWALYLDWRKANGQILRWEYEPDRFVFHEIESNARVYIPDFKVWTTENDFHYEEVKGWMDAASKTKLRRMNKYYPDTKVILVDESVYRSTERRMAHAIPGWLT